MTAPFARGGRNKPLSAIDIFRRCDPTELTDMTSRRVTQTKTGLNQAVALSYDLNVATGETLWVVTVVDYDPSCDMATVQRLRSKTFSGVVTAQRYIKNLKERYRVCSQLCSFSGCTNVADGFCAACGKLLCAHHGNANDCVDIVCTPCEKSEDRVFLADCTMEIVEEEKRRM